LPLRFGSNARKSSAVRVEEVDMSQTKTVQAPLQNVGTLCASADSAVNSPYNPGMTIHEGWW